MSRLPHPGADQGTWGTILNNYLQQEHLSDGAHDIAKILGSPPSDDYVLVSDQAMSKGVSWQSKTSLQGVGVPAGGTAGQVLQKSSAANYATGWQTLNKTDIGLGQVDDTADVDKPVSSAMQTALDGKEASIAGGAANQYWRGDKTWHDLDKTVVGLGSVDNTSDVNKPISTAQQQALDQKANKTDVVAIAVALS